MSAMVSQDVRLSKPVKSRFGKKFDKKCHLLRKGGNLPCEERCDGDRVVAARGRQDKIFILRKEPILWQL